MNIRLQYTLTADDFVEFQREHVRILARLAAEKPRKKMSIPALGWVLIAGLALILFVALHDGPGRSAAPARDASSDSSGIFAIVPYVIIGALILLYVLRGRLSRFIIRKAFMNDPQMGKRLDVTLSDEHATFRTETETSTKVWTHFTHFGETEALFVLIVSGATSQLIPKRAFGSPQELEEFRGFALAHVGNVPVGFPVQAVRPRTATASAPIESLEERRG